MPALPNSGSDAPPPSPDSSTPSRGPFHPEKVPLLLFLSLPSPPRPNHSFALCHFVPNDPSPSRRPSQRRAFMVRRLRAAPSPLPLPASWDRNRCLRMCSVEARPRFRSWLVVVASIEGRGRLFAECWSAPMDWWEERRGEADSQIYAGDLRAWRNSPIREEEL